MSVDMPVQQITAGATAGSMLGPVGSLAGGVIGAGAGLIGDLMQGNSSAANVASQEAFQQQSIEQQEQYATQMSDTQYQRSVADMKAAGLNPLAMFSSGSGGLVSSPQGSSASGSVAQPDPYSNAGSLLATGVNSANAVMAQQYALDAQQQSILASKASQRNVNAQTTKVLASLPGVSSANSIASAEAQLEALNVSAQKMSNTGEQSLLNVQQAMGAPYYAAKSLAGNDIVGAAAGAGSSALGVAGQAASQAGLNGVADLLQAAQ